MAFDPQTERENAAQQAADQPKPRLEPKYPWTPIAFDPWAFGVETDPPTPPEDGD